jgi:hypothetical protein
MALGCSGPLRRCAVFAAASSLPADAPSRCRRSIAISKFSQLMSASVPPGAKLSSENAKARRARASGPWECLGAEHRVRTGDLRLGNERGRRSRISPTLPESARSFDFIRVFRRRPRVGFHDSSRGFFSFIFPACATPPSGSRRASLDVTQVSELLGCSTAHVYDLCERSELPHYRDLQNAIRFDCRALGNALGLGASRAMTLSRCPV